jgi:heterotetrameric sarcosine oxidase gamma subunit
MTPATTPVRRSPLEGVVIRRAAATAAPAPVVLGELWPLDKLVVRGGGDAATLGRVVEDRGVAIWRLQPDESLVLFPPGEHAAVVTRLTGRRSTVDVSSGSTILRLHGPGARAVLAEVCPVDLSASAVPDRSIVQAMVANVRVVIARIDSAGQPAFALLVARDEARYLWDALSEVGEAHGLVHGDRETSVVPA